MSFSPAPLEHSSEDTLNLSAIDAFLNQHQQTLEQQRTQEEAEAKAQAEEERSKEERQQYLAQVQEMLSEQAVQEREALKRHHATMKQKEDAEGTGAVAQYERVYRSKIEAQQEAYDEAHREKIVQIQSEQALLGEKLAALEAIPNLPEAILDQKRKLEKAIADNNARLQMIEMKRPSLDKATLQGVLDAYKEKLKGFFEKQKQVVEDPEWFTINSVVNAHMIANGSEEYSQQEQEMLVEGVSKRLVQERQREYLKGHMRYTIDVTESNDGSYYGKKKLIEEQLVGETVKGLGDPEISAVEDEVLVEHMIASTNALLDPKGNMKVIAGDIEKLDQNMDINIQSGVMAFWHNVYTPAVVGIDNIIKENEAVKEVVGDYSSEDIINKALFATGLIGWRGAYMNTHTVESVLNLMKEDSKNPYIDRRPMQQGLATMSTCVELLVQYLSTLNRDAEGYKKAMKNNNGGFIEGGVYSLCKVFLDEHKGKGLEPSDLGGSNVLTEVTQNFLQDKKLSNASPFTMRTTFEEHYAPVIEKQNRVKEHAPTIVELARLQRQLSQIESRKEYEVAQSNQKKQESLQPVEFDIKRNIEVLEAFHDKPIVVREESHWGAKMQVIFEDVVYAGQQEAKLIHEEKELEQLKNKLKEQESMEFAMWQWGQKKERDKNVVTLKMKIADQEVEVEKIQSVVTDCREKVQGMDGAIDACDYLIDVIRNNTQHMSYQMTTAMNEAKTIGAFVQIVQQFIEPQDPSEKAMLDEAATLHARKEALEQVLKASEGASRRN